MNLATSAPGPASARSLSVREHCLPRRRCFQILSRKHAPPNCTGKHQLIPDSNISAPPTPSLQVNRRTLLEQALLGTAVTPLVAQAQTTLCPSEAIQLESPPLTSPFDALNPPRPSLSALRDPVINQGLAMGPTARQSAGLRGLLPPGVVAPQVEVQRALAAVRAAGGGLPAYRTLMAIRGTSTRVFYALLQQNIEELLPLVYTPVVGDACLAWGSLYPRPPGLYISMMDRGRVGEVLRAWPFQPRIAVVTDGERILGLGDLGAHGMGIPVGKATVYGGCGVDPDWVLPVTVDVGCDTDSVRDDPLYVGLPRRRARGPNYTDLMGEVVFEMRKLWGRRLVVHWEDVGARNSYRLLTELRGAGVPTFNDDIECTAAAAVGAMLAAVRVEGVPQLTRQRFLFFGAGQANIGTARLVLKALRREGVPEAKARRVIWMVDSHGLVTSDRSDLTPEKQEFAQPGPRVGKALKDIVAAVRPTALIGAAAVGGAFDEGVVRLLTQVAHERGGAGARPVVLALSNPTAKAECSFQDAYRWSDGAVLFASGTRFPGVELEGGKLVEASQVNNCYVFPGIGLGAVAAGGTQVTDDMLLAAATALAGSVSDQDIAAGRVMPQLKDLRGIARTVAAAVAAEAAAGLCQGPGNNRGAGGKGRGVPGTPGAEAVAAWTQVVDGLSYDPLKGWEVGE